MPSQDVQCALFRLSVFGSHPKKESSMVDLCLEVSSVVIAQPFGEQRSDNTSGAADQRCCNKSGEDCTTRNDHGARGGRSPSIHKGAHYTALSIADCLRRDICRTWNSRIVFEVASVSRAAAELFIRRVL